MSAPFFPGDRVTYHGPASFAPGLVEGTHYVAECQMCIYATLDGPQVRYNLLLVGDRPPRRRRSRIKVVPKRVPPPDGMDPLIMVKLANQLLGQHAAVAMGFVLSANSFQPEILGRLLEDFIFCEQRRKKGYAGHPAEYFQLVARPSLVAG